MFHESAIETSKWYSRLITYKYSSFDHSVKFNAKSRRSAFFHPNRRMAFYHSESWYPRCAPFAVHEQRVHTLDGDDRLRARIYIYWWPIIISKRVITETNGRPLFIIGARRHRACLGSTAVCLWSRACERTSADLHTNGAKQVRSTAFFFRGGGKARKMRLALS